MANDIDYKHFVLNLANQTPEDLSGYPDGKGGYILPNWLDRKSKGTIYHLDEINRAPKYVLQCMFNFINEGRIHTHHINQCGLCDGIRKSWSSTKYDVTHRQIGVTIAELKREGFTILLVEQNFNFARTVSDRYYVMEHGRIDLGFANSDLDPNNMERLHVRLGV